MEEYSDQMRKLIIMILTMNNLQQKAALLSITLPFSILYHTMSYQPRILTG